MEKFVISPDIKALIFDLDGTIADTMPLHYTAYQKALGNHAPLLTHAMFYQQAGVPAVQVMQILKDQHGLQIDPVETGHLKEAIYGEMLRAGVKVVPAVAAIVQENAAKYPMAVASGGTRQNVIQTLKTVGLLDEFQAVVSADEVKIGKPAPDMFLEAARRLGVSPELCLVFEDGEMGFKAATAAAMKWVDVRPWYPESLSS